ncbi:hypothetical protein cyc_03473 [Cyclospora cayetanensis]|uniref:Immune mapped protein 1 n=1 Tax=Cyclospora cayetanensis TaxID=88456 RepID=A0A1D3DB26_9EIME|nr:hypothetical protein cyc_03473 [Cyclospora cayetanensis]
MGAACSRPAAKSLGGPAPEEKRALGGKAEETLEDVKNAASERAENIKVAAESLDCVKEGITKSPEVEDLKNRAAEAADAAPPKVVLKEDEAMPGGSQQGSKLLLSHADQQLLDAAKQQVAAKTATASTSASAPPANSPLAYLFFASSLNEGSLIQLWAPSPMTPEQMKEKQYVLLASLIPARHKKVTKNKLTVNGGITCFQQEILYYEFLLNWSVSVIRGGVSCFLQLSAADPALQHQIWYKWDIWSKAQRQPYYQGWVKFLKAADEMEATIENKVIPITEEQDLKISVFSFVSVVPPPSTYKPGTNITPKRFGDLATESGGAYIQLSRRGGDAVFDEADVVKWLAAEGLELQQGGGITLDATGTYERRSDKKGGNVPATPT